MPLNPIPIEEWDANIRALHEKCAGLFHMSMHRPTDLALAVKAAAGDQEARAQIETISNYLDRANARQACCLMCGFHFDRSHQPTVIVIMVPATGGHEVVACGICATCGRHEDEVLTANIIKQMNAEAVR